jgi:hypothetical protein
MSNLASFSMLQEKVLKYKTDYGLEDVGLAFDWLVVDSIVGLVGEDELQDAITDGSMDGGIDAVYIEGRTVHIFNNKFTSEFDHTKKRFPETETSKIITTLDAIFSKDIGHSDVNEALWEKINEIWDAFNESSKGQLTFKIHLCSNKQKLDPAAQKRFEKALVKHRIVEAHYYDQEDIVSKILEKSTKK